MTARSVSVVGLAVLSASLFLAVAKPAHAGCTVECKSFHTTSFTITPPLDCLEKVGVPDDSTCVCDSTQVFRNACSSAVEVTKEGGDASCSGCGSQTVDPGKEFGVTVELQKRIPESGAVYTENMTARWHVKQVDDKSGTDHVIEISATAEIDPEASACSASPRPAPRGTGALAAALGLLVVAGLRRRR